MKISVFLTAVLISLASAIFSQEISPAEKMRTGKHYLYRLSQFNEAQIFPASSSSIEIYRIFVDPTFEHALSIRIEKEGKDHVLVAKYLSGQVGYDWGELKGEKKRRVKEKEWRKLLHLIDKASFWTLEPEEKESQPNEKGEVMICLDNTQWYLEGVKDGKYHVVDRYCPDPGAFKAIGLYMVKLSNLGIKKAALH